jgi:hypothetical protein
MMSLKDFAVAKATLSKNLLTQQTYTGVVGRLNTAGLVFTSDGLGTSTATSTTFMPALAGFDDQRLVVVCKYITPTTSGSESIGCCLRVQDIEVTGDTSYYYARVDSGVAKISRFLNSSTSSTTLTSTAWALAQNVYVTIDFQIVGSALSATFTSASGTPSPTTLTATDTSISSSVSGMYSGFMMCRTTASTGFFSSVTAYQL